MRNSIKKLEKLLELDGTKKDIILLILSGIALILSLTKMVHLPFDIAWVSIILCGVPIILEAMIGLVTAFDIKADVLVSLALIASVCIGENFAAGEVAFIMQLGALLEDLTVAKARAGIEKLVHLTPQTARILRDGVEEVVPAESVKVGDILRVLPGESVPVDGMIVSGQTSINQAVMTGEPIPVDKTVGDEVSSGTLNQFGAFEMKATKVGEDSSIQRMIRLVQSADAGKAKIVGLADRWATWIVVIALTAAALTWLISGKIIRAVTILVVFCPCALVLATPTAIMAAIGNATKHGFLVRERSDEELWSAKEFTMLPGEGICAIVNEKQVFAGNTTLLQEQGVVLSNTLLSEAENYLEIGSTVIYVAVDGAAMGFLVLSDTLRPESVGMIDAICEIGVQPVLLTGDHANAAHAIAQKLHISEVHADCLPEDKLAYIDDCQQNAGAVCMIGDGINDAPALKKSNVGIAMGGIGSDIAVDAADIALVDDKVEELPHLLALSRRMMTTIKLNLTFSMT